MCADDCFCPKIKAEKKKTRCMPMRKLNHIVSQCLCVCCFQGIILIRLNQLGNVVTDSIKENMIDIIKKSSLVLFCVAMWLCSSC